jgi:hypothetical protein
MLQNDNDNICKQCFSNNLYKMTDTERFKFVLKHFHLDKGEWYDMYRSEFEREWMSNINFIARSKILREKQTMHVYCYRLLYFSTIMFLSLGIIMIYIYLFTFIK